MGEAVETEVVVAEAREAVVASRVMMLYCMLIIVGSMYEKIEQLNECDLSSKRWSGDEMVLNAEACTALYAVRQTRLVYYLVFER
jgi:hypothetical protein